VIAAAGRVRTILDKLALLFAVAIGATACPAGEGDLPEGAPAPLTGGQVDEKSKLYNLIGRWYPTTEVTRLKDETLTPQEWCQQEPMRLTVMPDSVEVRCEKGQTYSAAIARVKTSTRPGEITLLLRVSKESPLRQVRFEEVRGPNASIAGLPCWGGRSQAHQRFPDYEILTRQILGGQRCSQIMSGADTGGSGTR
jgi:hypothetical protein